MPVENLGKQLRTVRERLGLSLRDVALRSIEVATIRGSDRYQISASWLARIESNPQHEIGAHPLIAVLALYSITLEELLAVDGPADMEEDARALPRNEKETTLLTQGAAEVIARRLLPDDSHTNIPPENTGMLRHGAAKRNGRFLRVVIGQQRNYLYPIVPSGSIALIDTHRRSLAVRGDVEIEVERPMFLLELRDGRYSCCWCEMVDRDESRAIILPHPTGRWRAIQIHLGKDASIRGQIVAVRIPVVREGS
jgi:transcriptional regulator with XRE-family HTH domain